MFKKTKPIYVISSSELKELEYLENFITVFNQMVDLKNFIPNHWNKIEVDLKVDLNDSSVLSGVVYNKIPEQLRPFINDEVKRLLPKIIKKSSNDYIKSIKKKVLREYY